MSQRTWFDLTWSLIGSVLAFFMLIMTAIAFAFDADGKYGIAIQAALFLLWLRVDRMKGAGDGD